MVKICGKFNNTFLLNSDASNPDQLNFEENIEGDEIDFMEEEEDTIISEPEQLNLEGNFQSLAADISEASNLPEPNGNCILYSYV